MTVCADDQHIRVLFFYDPRDLPAAMAKPQTGTAFESFLLELAPIEIQPLLIPSCYIVIGFLSQHQAGGALYHVY